MKETSRKSIFNFDSIVALCSILIALFLIHNEYNMPTSIIRQTIGPSFMPIAILIALIFSALLILFTSLRSTRKTEGSDLALAEPPTKISAGQYKVMGMIILGLVVYGVILVPVGFIISTTILILWQAQLFERGKWIRNLVVSILFSIVVYYLFVHVLEVMLPVGIITL
jgi:putative tricarboxylic transport membrane protein